MIIYLDFRCEYSDLDYIQALNIRAARREIREKTGIGTFVHADHTGLIYDGCCLVALRKRLHNPGLDFDIVTTNVKSFTELVIEQWSLDSNITDSTVRTVDLSEYFTPKSTSICYHCGAPSVKLFSSNECSQNCQGDKK